MAGAASNAAAKTRYADRLDSVSSIRASYCTLVI